MSTSKFTDADFFPTDLDKLAKHEKFLELFEKNPVWTSNGTYLGFPIEDIEFFVNHGGICNLLPAERSAYESSGLDGTGYMPAPKNLHKVGTVEDFSNVIAKHRHSKVKFPDEFKFYDEKGIEERTRELEFACKIAEKIYKYPYAFLKSKLDSPQSKIRSPALMEVAKNHFSKEYERSQQIMPKTKRALDQVLNTLMIGNLFPDNSLNKIGSVANNNNIKATEKKKSFSLSFGGK